MSFWTKYLELCTKNGSNANAEAKKMGIASATVSNWKKNGGYPQPHTLIKIADYFGVPVEYFSEETPAEIKESPAPRAEVEDIIKIYDMLTPERQKQLRTAIADLLKDQLQE